MREYFTGEDCSAASLLSFVAGAHSRGCGGWIEESRAPWLGERAGCRVRLGEDGRFYYVFEPWEMGRSGCSVWERLVACLLIWMLLPLFAVLALVVWISDGCPVFFVQRRAGAMGRSFRIFKFRTMVRRADKLHERLRRRGGGRQGRLFKLKRDPRVTRVGAFLRRSFLDELPQLVNVARGEMSFVGPRPLPESDDVHYTCDEHQMRLMGVPGMSGLWQVSGRNELTFDEMCLLDVYYLSNRSVGLNAAILCRTLLLFFGYEYGGAKGKEDSEEQGVV